ncbi:MAG: WYL domain-containing protein [Mesorhizobium sp.]|nr:WYL domain-containing protein [Mesorhizobium sp.]MBN9243967.1 WYL domain-containing protein [Mesorhizobium sp.]
MAFNDLVRVLEYNVSVRPIPRPPREVSLPSNDDVHDGPVEHLGDAEGQSFMIEYVDSTGRQSTRRISVYGIVLGRDGIPLLTARCHERNATRQFRVDRIRCCIDYDGEVHQDVTAFLADNFGMSRDLAARTTAGHDDDRWRRIVLKIRDDAVILAAISKSDGQVHSLEVQAAIHYLARRVEDDEAPLSDREISELGAYFRRMRPTGPAIQRAVEGIGQRDARGIQKLLMAAVDVLDADGKRHPAELELLNAICVEMVGAPIAAN